MTKRAPGIVLLLFAVLIGTLGVACFFSAPGNKNCTAAPVEVYSNPQWPGAFYDPDTFEYQSSVDDSVLYEYSAKIENAQNPVDSFEYEFDFSEEHWLNRYHVPTTTTFYFLGDGGSWTPGLQFTIVDTTNRVIAYLSREQFYIKSVDSDETLCETNISDGECSEIVLDRYQLRWTSNNVNHHLGFDFAAGNGLEFDFLISSARFDSTNSGTVVKATVYKDLTAYHYIGFIDPVFSQNNYQFDYNTDSEMDTVVPANVVTVPEVNNTGNYVFLGWYCGDKTPSDTFPTGYIVFYAQYKKATLTIKKTDGTVVHSKTVFIGDTLGDVIPNIDLGNYNLPQNLDLDMVITGDYDITILNQCTVALKYFKLQRYSVTVDGKTFNYDMLTYKTVSKVIPEGTTVDVNNFDSAHYNILGKPYYETMPGFNFLGWDYDITQPITQDRTITAQYELPKLKVNYYSSNNILFETREYDLVKDNLLLPVVELQRNYWDEQFWTDCKNFFENLFRLDFGGMVDDILVRQATQKMVEHLCNSYNEDTNQIFVVLAKPDLNSQVHKGWQGDLSGNFEGSSFQRLDGTRGDNNYVLYINPKAMYTSNINYELSIHFGDHFIDPALNATKEFFNGVGDCFGTVWDNLDIIFYVFLAVIAIILLVIFWPIISPIIIMVFTAVWKVIKKFFEIIWNLIKGFFKLLGKLFNKIFNRGNK